MRLGVDQVGTGNMAFAYLRRLPISYLRIDGSFSRNLAQAQDQRFVQSMVQIANNLDIDVLADGVEQEADADELWQAHVQALSGYYYGRPAPSPHLQLSLSAKRPSWLFYACYCRLRTFLLKGAVP